LVIPRRLVLRSEAGASETTIDAESKGIAVLVEILGQGTTIDGFRITHGYVVSGAHAAGIHAEATVGAGGALIIRNNIVEHGYSLAHAGGIYALRNSAVENNVIQFNNEAAGKATSALWAAGVVRGNVIRHNGDLGELMTVLVAVNVFENNAIVNNNYATSVVLIEAANGATIRNNTIASNGCGLSMLEISGFFNLDIRNNIVTHTGCSGLACENRGGGWQVQCNDVWGVSGESYDGDCAGNAGVDGNISLDPLFCATALDDFRLQESSPCATNNSPLGCGLIGAFPVCASVSTADQASARTSRVRVEPNPARGVVEFAGMSGHQSTIEVYNSAGRLLDVLESRGSIVRWERAQGVPRGVYLARVVDGDDVSFVKFLLIH
jgi:hypothetical protein